MTGAPVLAERDAPRGAGAPALRITVGAGDDRPQGKAVEVAVAGSRVTALVDALNALPEGQFQGWWSAALFLDAYRSGSHWESSEAVGVDLDYYGEPLWDDRTRKWKSVRAPLPTEVLACYRRAVKEGSLAGSAAHDTPGGMRVVFVLDAAATDPEALHRGAQGAVAAVERWIDEQGLAPRLEHGVPAHGMKVDVPASTDRVRFWYAPRCQAKGIRRAATVVMLRDRAYTLRELAAFASMPTATTPETPATTRAGARDFDAAVAAFNAAHPGDWPPAHGPCPACGHDGCFGAFTEDASRWACWSSNHGQDSSGCGLEGKRCWHGDALDLAAHAAGLSRADLLRREGLLSGGPRAGPSPASQPQGSVGSVGSVGRDRDGWPPLLRFGLAQDPTPFPVDALPPEVARWVRAHALMLQCPPDLPAILALGAGALAVAKKRVVCVHPRWLEHLNQFRVAGLLSGESKSPAYEAAMAPVRAWEAETRRRLRPAYDRDQHEQKAKHDRITHLRKQAARLGGGPERDELTGEIAALAQERRQGGRIRLPKLHCEDVTPEKLAEEMEAHGGRMGVLSDEAGPFEMMVGRYSDSPRLEVYLKGYSGTLLLVDRKGLPGAPVPGLRIEHPILTMVLTVQPAVIEGLAARKEMRTRGMLARFAYSLPASRVGSRDPAPPYASAADVDAYAALIHRLLDIEAPESEEGEYVPLPIGLSPQAYGLLKGLKATIEPRLGPGGDLAPMQDWVNKHWGRVLRVAGLLHLAGLPVGQGQAESSISGGEMERALLIGQYDLEHSRRAFASMAEPEEMAAARAVLEWLSRKGITLFKERDAHRALEHRFPRVEDLRRAMDVLEERSYVRRQHTGEGQQNARGGRPPSPVFEVHPEVRSNGSPGTQPTEPTEPQAAGDEGVGL